MKKKEMTSPVRQLFSWNWGPVPKPHHKWFPKDRLWFQLKGCPRGERKPRQWLLV